MSNQPIKLGIIGCGGIARAHLAAAKENGFPVVCVSDISEEAVNAFVADVPGARGFTSISQMIEEGGAEAVIICTPPRSHAEIALAAIKKGLHVLCEKPLAANVCDSLAIEEAAEKSNTVFMTAFRHRFIPAHQAMKALLDSGKLGRIILFQNLFGGPARFMKDRWFSKFALSGGGSLMDTSIHSIDLFRFYCGEIATFGGEIDQAFEGTDVEDSASLSVRSENGALGVIASSWNIGTGAAKVTIHAEHGTLTYDYIKSEEYTVHYEGQAEPEVIAIAATSGNTEQLANFAQAIRTGSAAGTRALDGRRAVEVVEGVYRQRPYPAFTKSIS